MSPKGAIRLLKRSLKHSHEGFSIFLTLCLAQMYISEIMFENLLIYDKLVICIPMANSLKISVDNV